VGLLVRLLHHWVGFLLRGHCLPNANFLLIDKGYQLDEVDLAEDIFVDKAKIALRLYGLNQGVKDGHGYVLGKLLSRHYVVLPYLEVI
jgi:hypothetical protein